jgi:hypothetical protein
VRVSESAYATGTLGRPQFEPLGAFGALVCPSSDLARFAAPFAIADKVVAINFFHFAIITTRAAVTLGDVFLFLLK